jgi:adenine phosphoribosyltransferase
LKKGIQMSQSNPAREVYPVAVAGLKRNLPLFEVAPGVQIAVLNILGDTELIQGVAEALAARLKGVKAEVLVTAEAKSIPMLYALAVEMGLPWVVLRKSYKPYMGDTISAETVSITTGKPQTLYLDEKDRSLVGGKRVVLVDDVISTGSTLKGMESIVAQAGGEVVARAGVFTEGDPTQWEDIIALGHLPVFTSD